MPIYSPPLRDQRFVMHELLGAVDVLKRGDPSDGGEVTTSLLEQRHLRCRRRDLSRGAPLRPCKHHLQRRQQHG
jgi:hypothetical protein